MSARSTWLWTAAVALAVAVPAIASAARAPTVTERAAIRQAIFDYVTNKGRPARPVVKRILVSTRTLRARASGPNRYRRFARVDLDDPRAGFAAALLGYYVAPISGWRVLSLGSAQVGCAMPARIFQGRKSEILGELRLRC
ncbi:MAG TPA: hypothetical protein VE596_08090 [Gaiellaceae bacterium]|nr:hypothetical protein [Gaiellaceae bacterium]